MDAEPKKIGENIRKLRNGDIHDIGGYLFYIKSVLFIHSDDKSLEIQFLGGRSIAPIFTDDQLQKLRLSFVRYCSDKDLVEE